MRSHRSWSVHAVIALVLCAAADARAQGQPPESRWVFDLGTGVDPSINGNVNSGAIGTLQGQATAVLPNPYGEVYGTGIELHFGAGYTLNDDSELRGMFTFQSADADLVRLGDIGPSSLYVQYSDYKSFGLDIGYRRYFMPARRSVRPYGEAMLGAAFVDRINAQFAAPRSNLIFNSTDFYDSTAAFTWRVNFGVLFRVAPQLDLNAQLGLRHVGGLSQVDQFVGSGLEDINNDTGRLTFPIAIGVRFRFR
jgi:hypothetical protein